VVSDRLQDIDAKQFHGINSIFVRIIWQIAPFSRLAFCHFGKRKMV
jgi:hypothetical protein